MSYNATGFGAVPQSSGRIYTIVIAILPIFKPKTTVTVDQKAIKTVFTGVLEEIHLAGCNIQKIQA